VELGQRQKHYSKHQIIRTQVDINHLRNSKFSKLTIKAQRNRCLQKLIRVISSTNKCGNNFKIYLQWIRLQACSSWIITKEKPLQICVRKFSQRTLWVLIKMNLTRSWRVSLTVTASKMMTIKTVETSSFTNLNKARRRSLQTQ